MAYYIKVGVVVECNLLHQKWEIVTVSKDCIILKNAVDGRTRREDRESMQSQYKKA